MFEVDGEAAEESVGVGATPSVRGGTTTKESPRDVSEAGFVSSCVVEMTLFLSLPLPFFGYDTKTAVK